MQALVSTQVRVQVYYHIATSAKPLCATANVKVAFDGNVWLISHICLEDIQFCLITDTRAMCTFLVHDSFTVNIFALHTKLLIIFKFSKLESHL